MIKIKKRDFNRISKEEKQENAFKRLSDADQELKRESKKPSKDFNSSRWSKVKKSIAAAQHDKCCYCERKLDPETGETDVEHYRPKKGIWESSGHGGYWWLAYDIDNLLFSCKDCNIKKGTRFPVKKRSARANSRKRNIAKEKPLLINPLKEDPSPFFKYDLYSNNLFLEVTSSRVRGKKTIEIAGLNSDTKLKLRKADFKKFSQTLGLCRRLKMRKKAIKAELEIYTDDSAQFAGLCRFALEKEGIN